MNLKVSFPKFLKGFFTSSGTRSGVLALLNRTQYQYGNLDVMLNGAVVACVGWIARNFPEAPVLVRRLSEEGEWEWEPEHALSRLLKRPNPFYSGALLQMALITEYVVLGNAYLRKIRSNAGRVVELWWLPAALVEPKWPSDGSAYILHYQYNPSGGVPENIPPEDMVHLRYGLDSANTRKGRSPLASVLREIFTDDEAANFSASLLRNMGVPGVVLAPKDGTFTANEEDLKATRERFRESFGGDKRGDVMVMTGPTDIHVLSFNPQQMDLKGLRRVPEERVSAVLGIPAIVAGLGAGLDRSTFANFAEAREMAYENGIIPLQRLVSSELTEQLLPEFESKLDGIEVGFDLSNVRILQEDEDNLARRVALLLAGGVITRGEARQQVGMEAEERDDVYHLPLSVLEVPRLKQREEELREPVTRALLPAGNGRVRDYPSGFAS